MKKTILFASGLLFLVIAFLFIKSQSQTSVPSPEKEITKTQTYKNAKSNYSINYPLDWAIREYPDTGTGAAFRPSDKANDFMSEFITINKSPKVLSDKNEISFEDYVKTAASNEIQNYQSLVSMEKVSTASGAVGYTTIWKVRSMDGKETSESTPITYFQIPDDKTATIQLVLTDKNYLDIYNSMIKSFKFN